MRNASYALSEAQVREAYQMHCDGVKLAYLAKKYFVGIETLRTSFKRYGLKSMKKRPIRNKTTGEVFESFASAAKAYNLQGCNIGKVCRGERERCGGMEWEYADQ